MNIVKLEWLSVEAKEAELIVSDGVNRIIAFSQPCEYSLGDVIDKPLLPLYVKDLMLSRESEPSLHKLNTPFGYKITALITDIDNGIVAVGGILIDASNIPSWAKNGDYVDFTVGRLDLW